MAFLPPQPVAILRAFPRVSDCQRLTRELPRLPHQTPRRRAPRADLTRVHISLPGRGVALEVLATPPLAAALPARSAASTATSATSAPDTSDAATATIPPILFIHGSLHAAWCYTRFLTRLSATSPNVPAAAVSLRGYTTDPLPVVGKSVSAGDHIADIVALLSALPGPPPVLVAHSFGGLFAQHAISAAGPSAVAGLVLLASSPPAGNRGMVMRTVRKHGLALAWRITLGFVRRTVASDVEVARDMFFTRRGSRGRTVDDEVEGDAVIEPWMREFAAAADHPINMRSVQPLTDRTAVSGMAGRVLVMGGEDDVIVDEVALRDAADFWGAREPLLLPRTPHDLMLATGWEAAFDAMYAWIRDDLPSASLVAAEAEAAGGMAASDD